MPSDKLHHNTGKGKKSESESSLPEKKPKYEQTKKKETKPKKLSKEKQELLEDLNTLTIDELEEKKNIYIKNGFKTQWSEARKAINKKIEEEALEEENKKSKIQRDKYIADGIATFEPTPLDEKPEEEKERQIKEIEREEEELIKEIAELRAIAEELKKQIDALPDDEDGVDASTEKMQALMELEQLDEEKQRLEIEKNSMISDKVNRGVIKTVFTNLSKEQKKIEKLQEKINEINEKRIIAHSILYPKVYEIYDKINPEYRFFPRDFTYIKDKDNNYQDPLEVPSRSYQHFKSINEKEGFFEFNFYGFYMILKNKEEVRDEDGINSHSSEARYKVMGPDGRLLIDNVGYNEADKICKEEIEKYKTKLLEEETEVETPQSDSVFIEEAEAPEHNLNKDEKSAELEKPKLEDERKSIADKKETDSFMKMITEELPNASPEVFISRVKEISRWLDRGGKREEKKKFLPNSLLNYIGIFEKIDENLNQMFRGGISKEETANLIKTYKNNYQSLDSITYKHGLEAISLELKGLERLAEKTISNNIEKEDKKE